MEEKLIGEKWLFRQVISNKVVMTMDAATMFRNCVFQGCSKPRGTYKNFFSMFHSLYMYTAVFINNAEIIRKIEAVFNAEKPLETREQYDEYGKILLNVFMGYVVQLKEDGLYNPEINVSRLGIEDAYEQSV